MARGRRRFRVRVPLMSTTLGAARKEALALLTAGDYPAALLAYQHLLVNAPEDGQLRFKIADLLVKVGVTDEAAGLYKTLGEHAVRTGHPLWAMVSAHALAA